MKSPNLFRPGSIIQDKYIIEKPIGQGGMSKTYLAKIEGSIYKVVLKVVVFSEMKVWKTLELFEREAKTLKNLDHPNIPKYIDDFHIETEDEIYYILVMEYIQGKNLYDLIHEGKKFTEHQVINILKSLLQTLDYIHTLNPAVIHRDIQPKNIIFKPTGKVYLVDFGGVGQIIKETLYGGSTMIGTFGYFPHEQLLGKAYPSSDLYSLGMTMIFLLTGKDPSNFDLIDEKVYYTPFVNISDELKSLLDKMIEPFQKRRYQNAKFALNNLKNILTNKTNHYKIKDIRENNTLKLEPIKKIEIQNFRFKNPTKIFAILFMSIYIPIFFMIILNKTFEDKIFITIVFTSLYAVLLAPVYKVLQSMVMPTTILKLDKQNIIIKTVEEDKYQIFPFSKILFLRSNCNDESVFWHIEIDFGKNWKESRKIYLFTEYCLSREFVENLVYTIEQYRSAYNQRINQ